MDIWISNVRWNLEASSFEITHSLKNSELADYKIQFYYVNIILKLAQKSFHEIALYV